MKESTTYGAEPPGRAKGLLKQIHFLTDPPHRPQSRRGRPCALPSALALQEGQQLRAGEALAPPLSPSRLGDGAGPGYLRPACKDGGCTSRRSAAPRGASRCTGKITGSECMARRSCGWGRFGRTRASGPGSRARRARPDSRAGLPAAAHAGAGRAGAMSGPSAQGGGSAPAGRAQCADVQTNQLLNGGGKGKLLL